MECTQSVLRVHNESNLQGEINTHDNNDNAEEGDSEDDTPTPYCIGGIVKLGCDFI